MMNNIQWIFSGIGVEVLKILGGSIVGGFVGYKIGVSKKGKQVQTARKNAEQSQDILVENKSEDVSKGIIKKGLKQVQKAGDGAKQIQTGRIN